MPGGKKVMPSGCIEIEKFIFGVAMADHRCQCHPKYELFSPEIVLLPNARPKIKIDCTLGGSACCTFSDFVTEDRRRLGNAQINLAFRSACTIFVPAFCSEALCGV